jgi:serine protease Do
VFVEKFKQLKLLSFVLLLFTLVLGIVIGTVINTDVKAERQSVGGVAPDATPLHIPQAVSISNEFTKLTKRVEPSVVYIESDYLPKPGKRTHKADPDDDGNDSPDDPPHSKDPSDLFKRYFGPPQQKRNLRTEGSGTGFIVDKNGYIITNQHVVENADRIKVKLADDETEYRARIVGIDDLTDLAVLKINTKQPLVPVQIGNSDGVQVGDWVIAIGSPFGLQATVTAGIISAQRTSRDLPGAKQFQNFLQTDAAINPGNSGGPLLNVRGEVIGVNTMIATRSGTYEGYGFALPSNMAVKVYNDIIHDGRVIRGSIGIRWTHSAADTDTLQAFGLDHGVIVQEVAPTGPAGMAGVRPDDIIISMNDRPVKDGQELVNKVADLPIGSSAMFTVDRDGKQKNFKVEVGEREAVWAETESSSARPPDVPAPTPDKRLNTAKFGITIMRLTEKERADLAIEEKGGVKVVTVDPGSFADDIGMEEGDAILSINRQHISSTEDVTKVPAAFKAGQAVAVHVVRSTGGAGKHGEPQRVYLAGRWPEN